MGILSKIKKRIKKAIPREAAPFLPALASIFGGPMIASMFGAGMNPIIAQGLGSFLADAGTQELTSDRTRLESSLVSGIFGGLRGSTMDPTLNKNLATEGFGTETGAKAYGLSEEALKEATTGQRVLKGAQDFAMAGYNNPISMAGAGSISTQAAPKLGYNEIERFSRDLAARAAESARQQGLDYEEAMKYAEQYYYGSNPDATEEDFNQFMDYYNSDLINPNMANGGRIGFEEGGFSSSADYNTATEKLPKDLISQIARPGSGFLIDPGFPGFPNPQPSPPPRPPEEAIKDKLNNFYETGSPNPIRFPGFPGMPKGLTLQQRLENFNAKQAGSPEPHRNPFERRIMPAMPFRPYPGFIEDSNRQNFADGSQDYMGDVYGDRDRDSLDMKEFYKEYPETQVGSYINENRYKSEKIEKLEAKLNEIIDMRQRTADRNRNPENDGIQSLMEKLLDKEINSLYAERTNDDIRKSEAQKRDEMKARFDAQAQQQAQEKEAAYQAMFGDGLNRTGRAMGGMMNNNMMNPRIGYANGGIPDRPNFNYGSGRQTPNGDPIAPNVPPGMQMDLRPGGFIELGTEPRADDVPAMVGKDEFVLNDRAVAGIGKALTGRADPRAGARALYDLQSQMEATV